MRVSEIAQLHLADVVVDLARPHIRVRAGAAKGNRPRVVPLWWDEGTLRDLAAWKEERVARGASPDDPFVGCQDSARLGTPLSRHTLRKRFRTACKVLGRSGLIG
jgi:integrase